MKTINASTSEYKPNPVLVPLTIEGHEVTFGFQNPLIQLNNPPLSTFQEGCKSVADICLAFTALILTLPLGLVLAIIIKLTSKGPVFYSQERIGRFGKPFYLHKFRSMYEQAEMDGPQLASKNDKRITRVGKWMRRFRLDEIPNLISVIGGDMSMVGPRPERKFYLDRILKKAPEYKFLFKVKPGITSLGQINYGYAENIDEMVQRMHFDLPYLDTMSFATDLGIMLKTIGTILKGKGV
jgi:lipopolysaccharide/colanic/teichoic acid biosynthesis glycosyltransferase